MYEDFNSRFGGTRYPQRHDWRQSARYDYAWKDVLQEYLPRLYDKAELNGFDIDPVIQYLVRESDEGSGYSYRRSQNELYSCYRSVRNIIIDHPNRQDGSSINQQLYRLLDSFIGGRHFRSNNLTTGNGSPKLQLAFSALAEISHTCRSRKIGTMLCAWFPDRIEIIARHGTAAQVEWCWAVIQADAPSGDKLNCSNALLRCRPDLPQRIASKVFLDHRAEAVLKDFANLSRKAYGNSASWINSRPTLGRRNSVDSLDYGWRSSSPIRSRSANIWWSEDDRWSGDDRLARQARNVISASQVAIEESQRLLRLTNSPSYIGDGAGGQRAIGWRTPSPVLLPPRLGHTLNRMRSFDDMQRVFGNGSMQARFDKLMAQDLDG